MARIGIGGGNRILRGGVSVGRGGVGGGVGVGPFRMTGGFGGGGIFSALLEMLLWMAVIAAFILFQLWPIALYLVFLVISLLSPFYFFSLFSVVGILTVVLAGLISPNLSTESIGAKGCDWVARNRRLLASLPIVTGLVFAMGYAFIAYFNLFAEWRKQDNGPFIGSFVIAQVISIFSFIVAKTRRQIVWNQESQSIRASLENFFRWYVTVPMRLNPRVILETYSLWYEENSLKQAFMHSISNYWRTVVNPKPLETCQCGRKVLVTKSGFGEEKCRRCVINDSIQIEWKNSSDWETMLTTGGAKAVFPRVVPDNLEICFSSAGRLRKKMKVLDATLLITRDEILILGLDGSELWTSKIVKTRMKFNSPGNTTIFADKGAVSWLSGIQERQILQRKFKAVKSGID